MKYPSMLLDQLGACLRHFKHRRILLTLCCITIRRTDTIQSASLFFVFPQPLVLFFYLQNLFYNTESIPFVFNASDLHTLQTSLAEQAQSVIRISGPMSLHALGKLTVNTLLAWSSDTTAYPLTMRTPEPYYISTQTGK
jgi:hypothetical protein